MKQREQQKERKKTRNQNKRNKTEKEDERNRRLQELDEAVAGRVKVEAWPQMVDVAFADQLIAVQHWTMALNVMKCI